MATGRMVRVVDELLSAAEQAASDRAWDRVLSLCEDVLAVDPDNHDAATFRTLAERHVGRAVASAGRRQVTVLFADLAGSTAMGEALDPEAYLEVIRAYETACRSVIDHYGGHVNRFAGDGVVAFFGYPAAHEDDATRATLAALQMLEGLRGVSDDVATSHGVVLAARIGVHTGPVVLIDRGSDEWASRDDAFGPTVNMAARLQGVAEPGRVVVSDTTAGLVAPSVSLRPLGPRDLAGVPRRVEVFVATGPAAGADGGRAAAPALVGRARERDDLLARLEVARRDPDGPGRAVLLRGEVGIGKSRLLAELVTEASASGGTCTTLPCSALPVVRSLHPVRQALIGQAGIETGDPSRTRLVKLRALVDAAGLAPDDVVPHLATLLSVDTGGEYPPVELDPLRLREALLDRLVALVGGLARRRGPLVVAVEDVQWADQTTVDLLQRIVAGRVPGALVVMTSRPSTAWPAGQSAVDVVEVGPLALGDMRDLIRATAPSSLDDRVVDAVVRRSDGVPLYARSLADAVAAGGIGPGPVPTSPQAVPGPLVDLLQSRLDTLGRSKAVAQVAATIGREVDLPLLRRVVGALAGDDGHADADGDRGLDGASLDADMARLVDSHLVDADAGESDRVRFHHALVRDAAYASQLHRVARRRHRAVAEALAAVGAAGEPADLALIAYHHDRGGDAAHAVTAYLDAADHAAQLGVVDEALAHIARSDELLPEVEGPEAAHAELRLLLARGGISTSLGGWSAPGARDDYERALELATKGSDDPEAGPASVRALIGLWSWYTATGAMARGAEVCDAIGKQLTRTPMPAGLPALDTCRGAGRLYQGRLRESRALFERAVAGFRSDDVDDWAAWQIPTDPLAASLAFLASLQYLMGEEGESLATIAIGLERTGSLPYPYGQFSEAYVRAYESWVRRTSGDVDGASAALDELFRIADRHGFLYWTVVGRMNAEATAIVAGPSAEAVAGLGAAVAGYRALGGQAMVPGFLLEQAAGHLAIGDVDGAAACVDDALAYDDQRNARPEGLRLRAEVRAARGDEAEASLVRSDLAEALGLVHEEGAHTYENLIVESWQRLVGGGLPSAEGG